MRKHFYLTIVAGFFTLQGFSMPEKKFFPAGCSVAGTASAAKDSICVGGDDNLLLTGYVGTIQWQSDNGGGWVDETGSGSTTDNYMVTLSVSTSFRAIVTNTGCPPDTSNAIAIVVGVVAPTTTGASRCGYGQVTVNAIGSGIKWFDALTGGNLLYSGSSYTTNVASTTTFYAAATSNGGGSGTTPMPAEQTTFGGNARGYWFIAPSDFTITGLFVPNPINGSTQNIALVRFTPAVPPPLYATTTNAFNTLFLTQNDASTGVIPVNIQIFAGDVIGVLGTRGADVNSYSTSPSTTVIDGQTVTITRMGMQFPLATLAPQDLWQEAGGSISRVEITYEVGCESSRTAAVATINPSDTISIQGSNALCQGQSTILTASSTNSNYNYTWSPSTGLSSTTGASVTANPVTTITYTVVGDDGTCANIDSITISVGPTSVAGTATISTDTICLGSPANLNLSGYTGNIQWQSNNGSGWVNETGTGNTSPQYQVSPTVTTQYQAVVTSGGCAPATTVILNLEVLTITDPVTLNDTICGPGQASLSATGSGLLNWYTAATGGSSINTGSGYSPSISSTTTYYVEASAGGTYNVGPVTNGIGNQNSIVSADYGLQFDVTQQVTIDRVYIYPQQLGNVTINLRDAQGGPVLNTVTVAISTFGKVPVNLGFTVSPFSGYRLELATGSIVCSYNTTGAVYPYVTAGSPLSITGYVNPFYTTGPLYYYFYDWVVSEGCKSNRIPVTGVVLTPPSTPVINQNGNTLTSSSATGNQWYYNGNILPGETGQTLNITQTGNYSVTVTDANGCTATGTFNVTTIGLNELNAAGINVYPNPASDKINIDFTTGLKDAIQVRLIHTTGAVVFEKEQAGSVKHLIIETKKYAAGTYWLEIKSAEGLYRKSIIKN